MLIPAPDSPKVRRQRAAAEILETLQEKMSSPATEGGGGGEAGGAADPEVATTMTEVKKKKLPCYLHPGWLFLALLLLFAGEVALVTIEFELPLISLCDTCDAREQQYYAGVALGLGFVFTISFLAFRKSKLQAVGKKGPLLETAPIFLVLAYLCWLGVAAYTSWVVDSWAVLVHVGFLPLIVGLFFSAHHRWVVDDFHLGPPRKSSDPKMARVVPSDSADDGAGEAGGGDDGAADAAGDAAGGAADATAGGTPGDGEPAEQEKNCLQRVPWTVRIWILTLVFNIAYGGVLHAVSEPRFRWVGWSIASAVLVLALTFMSNRLWFGTLQIDKAQPILWGFVVLILVAWALLVWYFEGQLQLDYFAISLLGVVFLYPAAYSVFLAVQVLRDSQWNPKDKSTWLFVRNAILLGAVVYSIFLVLIAFAFWPVTLCGFCLLLMAALLAGSLIYWQRNNRFVSRKVKIGVTVCIGILVLGAAGGITYYFQSIFFGFSVVCIGVVLLLLGAGLLEVSDSQQRTALERLRIGSSDFVFPMFRYSAGRLTFAQTDIVAFLQALFVSSIWGLVAAAVMEDWPSLGMVVAVLSIMAALILLADSVSSGGQKRAFILRDLARAQLYSAVRDALDSGEGKAATVADDPSSSDPPAAVDEKETRKELVEALQKFRSERQEAYKAYSDQVKVACAGRFNTFPLAAFFHTLNAGVALIRKGQGCVTLTSPSDPREEHRTLLQCARSRRSAVRGQQRFQARLQLCLVSAQASQTWAKESEFRAFLQSTGAHGKGLTMDDFKQLPESERQELEDAWQTWKNSEAEKLRQEEERRKEEEEAARKRKEEARRRKAQAREDLEKMAASCGVVKKIQDAIYSAFAAGLTDSDDVMGKAQQRVKELQDIEKALQDALESTDETDAQVEILRNAAGRASVIGLESDLIDKANQKIEDVLAAIAAREEEERKKKEAERHRKLQEEARKRKEEKEEERKRKKEEAMKELEAALDREEESAEITDILQAAIDKATVAGIEGDLIDKAKSRITEIQVTLDATADEDRKKKEEERRRKLAEEAERKRKEAEAERKRKEEEERKKRAGAPKVIEANLDELKAQVREKDFEDTAWTPQVYGSKAHDPQYKIQKLREAYGEVELFTDGCSPGDIHQGELGDCWFLSAIACLSAREEKKPREEQMKDLFTYADPKVGLFVVRFYKNGVYQDIVVDDRFPFKWGQCSFAKSGKKKECWVQVIEKAYAKLHGSYDAIEGGFVNDGLVDMTGGMGGQMRLSDTSVKKEINDGTFWATLRSLNSDGHLLGCGSGAGKDTDISDMGIVKGHAYSLLRVEEIDGHRLVQLRNPWGSTEWKGKWSDNDEDSWTQKMKKKLDFKKADDGSFWMAFEDFVLHYRSLYICRVFNDEWNRILVSSEWRGETAGGCSNNHSKFVKNPRIKLQIKGRIKLFLTLMQHDSRGVGEGDGEVPIGFRVFKSDHLYSSNSVCGTGTYAYDREVFVDTNLEENSKGPYLIVPTTFDAGQERAFTMKAYWKGDPTAVSMWKD